MDDNPDSRDPEEYVDLSVRELSRITIDELTLPEIPPYEGAHTPIALLSVAGQRLLTLLLGIHAEIRELRNAKNVREEPQNTERDPELDLTLEDYEKSARQVKDLMGRHLAHQFPGYANQTLSIEPSGMVIVCHFLLPDREVDEHTKDQHTALEFSDRMYFMFVDGAKPSVH